MKKAANGLEKNVTKKAAKKKRSPIICMALAPLTTSCTASSPAQMSSLMCGSAGFHHQNGKTTVRSMATNSKAEAMQL